MSFATPLTTIREFVETTTTALTPALSSGFSYDLNKEDENLDSRIQSGNATDRLFEVRWAGGEVGLNFWGASARKYRQRLLLRMVHRARDESARDLLARMERDTDQIKSELQSATLVCPLALHVFRLEDEQAPRDISTGEGGNAWLTELGFHCIYSRSTA